MTAPARPPDGREPPKPLTAPVFDFANRVMILPQQHPLLVQQLQIPIAFFAIKSWAAAILNAEAQHENNEFKAALAKTPKIFTRDGVRLVKPEPDEPAGDERPN